MILMLPLEVLVQVHRNGYFLRRRPPNPPSPRRLWPGQAGQSLTSPSCLPSPSPTIFSVKFGASQQVFWDTPKNMCKNPCNICTNNSCKQSVQKSAQKNRAKKMEKNLCRKSVQKLHAKNPCKNPCKKSVQKVRAENPYKESVRNKPVQTASPK